MMAPKTIAFGFIFALTLISTTHAEESAMKGVKLGFGYDRGFGITGSLGNFYGFIGNDGVAVDYIFYKEKLKVEVDAPVHWYVGAGGYVDWKDDFGARLPVGAEVKFAKNVDAYAQAIPRVRVNNGANFGLGLGIGVRYIFE